MPIKIPRIRPSAQLGKPPSARLGTRTSPEDFGATVGKGLSDIGVLAAQEYQRGRSQANLTIQLQAKNFLADWQAENLDKDLTGYLKLQGKEVFDKREPLLQSVPKAVEQASKLFTNENERKLFIEAVGRPWSRRVTGLVQKHVDNTRHQINQNNRVKLSTNFLRDVRRHAQDPSMVATLYEDFSIDITENGAAYGIPVGATEKVLNDSASAAYTEAIDSLLTMDNPPLEIINQYLKDKSVTKFLPNKVLQQYEQSLDRMTAKAEIDTIGDEIFSKVLKNRDFGENIEADVILGIEKKFKGEKRDQIVSDIKKRFEIQRDGEQARRNQALWKYKLRIDAAGAQEARENIAWSANKDFPELTSMLLQYAQKPRISRRRKAAISQADKNLDFQQMVADKANIRTLIDNGEIPPPNDPMGRGIFMMMNHTLHLGEDANELWKYWQEGGQFGTKNLQTMINTANKNAGRRSLDRSQLAKEQGVLYEAVKAFMAPGVTVTQERVDQIVAGLLAKGYLKHRDLGTRWMTGLEAFKKGAYAYHLPEVHPHERESIRREIRKRGENPDPADEPWPDYIEAGYKREFKLGLPRYGETGDAWRREIGEAAEESLRDRKTELKRLELLADAQAEAGLAVVRAAMGPAQYTVDNVTTFGATAMTRQLSDLAAEGKWPAWFRESLQMSGEWDDFLQDRSFVQTDLTSSPRTMQDLIERWGRRLIEKARER